MAHPATLSAEDAALARLVRRESGLIVAQLQRRLGDFDVAEEAVQEAISIALLTWRRDGIPSHPAAWLALTARRRAIDLLRKRSREQRLVDALGADPTTAELATGPRRRRPVPPPRTSDCRCCSAAATRPSPSKPGWPSPCVRWSA